MTYARPAAQSASRLASFLGNTASTSPSPGNGTQVEYLATDGDAFRATPGGKAVQPGEWQIRAPPPAKAPTDSFAPAIRSRARPLRQTGNAMAGTGSTRSTGWRNTTKCGRTWPSDRAGPVWAFDARSAPRHGGPWRDSPGPRGKACSHSAMPLARPPLNYLESKEISRIFPQPGCDEMNHLWQCAALRQQLLFETLFVVQEVRPHVPSPDHQPSWTYPSS